MVYQVKDLSPEQRQAAEILLGRPVSEDEAVIVRSVGSSILPARLSPEERILALRGLEERFAARPRPEISDEEETDAVNEAMRSSRPNYRPAV